MKSLKCILLFCGLYIFQTISATRNTTIIYHKDKLFPLNPFVTVCYGKLGCFYNGPPFQHPYERPISIPPLPPELQGTSFFLYTRSNRKIPFIFSPLYLNRALKSTFRASKFTRVIIHSGSDGVFISTWQRQLKDQYLAVADENIILVNYRRRLPPPFWNRANARVVGAQIWKLIDFLCKRVGAFPETFHLIGHGLGAHVAGYAGERLHGLGRITALDPDGLNFKNVPAIVKLEQSDALFVDIIHTDPARNVLEGLGTPEDIGHVNFWTNGFRNKTCIPQRTLATGATAIETLENTLFCNHFKAIDLFIYSFNQQGCLFVGAECPSSEEFYAGRCNCGKTGDKCRFMGQLATPAPYETRYYIRLQNTRPYCLHQYQVIIYVEIPYLHKTYGSLHVSADLIAVGEKTFQETLQFRMNLKEHSQVKTFLLAFKEPIGKVNSATAVLHIPHQSYNLSISIEAIEINYLFPIPKSEISNLLCRDSKTSSYKENKVKLSASDCDSWIKRADD